METAIIIPALNEQACISDLVIECLKQTGRVVVADNGSTDGTANSARRAGAQVVCEPRQGYGYACAAGAAAAGDAEILVFIDADFSFLPSEMPSVIAPLQRRQADLVLGSRTLGFIAPGAMPAHQLLGNMLITWLIKQAYGIRLSDVGPYRAVRRELLESLEMREMTYGWPIEMIVKAARTGARTVEVPVSYHRRRGGNSKVSGTWHGSLVAGYRFLGVVRRNLP